MIPEVASTACAGMFAIAFVDAGAGSRVRSPIETLSLNYSAPSKRGTILLVNYL